MGTTLHPLIHLLILITITATTKSQAQNTTDPILFCSDSNFTTNSNFNTNLNRLLPDLTAAAVSSGFGLKSEGSQTGQVFGAALCRGDASKDKCQLCLSAAAELIHQNCSQSIDALVWEEYCMLRYSNTSITYEDNDGGRIWDCSDKTVAEVDKFESSLKSLMGSLAGRAAYESSAMFATGDKNYSGSSKVYGLTQCTKDLTQDQCYNCLMGSLGSEPDYCWGSEGGVIVGYSCIMRFEVFPYYNESVGAAAPSTAVLAPPTSPGVEELGNGTAGGRRKRGKLND